MYILKISAGGNKTSSLSDLAWFGPSPLSDTLAQTIPAGCSLFQPIASGSASQPDPIGCASPLPCGCWRWSNCRPVSRRGRWLRAAGGGWSSAPLHCWGSDCPPGWRQVLMEQEAQWLMEPEQWTTSVEPRRRRGVPGPGGKTQY